MPTAASPTDLPPPLPPSPPKGPAAYAVVIAAANDQVRDFRDIGPFGGLLLWNYSLAALIVLAHHFAERPTLRDEHTTLGREAELVRAYLAVYQVRMGPRLRTEIDVPDELAGRSVPVVTAEGEALISTPLEDLLARLDPEVFWQVHRGTVVNVNAVRSVVRGVSGKLALQLKQRAEKLEVSATYASRFKQL